MASNSVTFVVGSETFQTSYTIKWRPQTHGRPIVLYDQLGTGESTHVCAGFFTPALFVAELDNLIPWGVTPAVEYIAAHRPQGFKHLILTNGSASCHEREGTTDAREYQEGPMRFYRKHALNLEVWPPAEATKSLTQMGEDPTVYRAMLGVNEFVMRGVLKDWSVNPKLGKVSCPTLIINGADDAIQDSCVAPLFYGIQKAKWVTLGSMASWE
ncbi:proline-specific peptidase [Lactarius hengduanensis]|nr:proline-specific peptidase [Lactarius hengduanensis]